MGLIGLVLITIPKTVNKSLFWDSNTKRLLFDKQGIHIIHSSLSGDCQSKIKMFGYFVFLKSCLTLAKVMSVYHSVTESLVLIEIPQQLMNVLQINSVQTFMVPRRWCLLTCFDPLNITYNLCSWIKMSRQILEGVPSHFEQYRH